MQIDLSNIVKTYEESNRQRLIFNDTSICFPAEKFSVVMGRSGVGKSSLLNLISGIDLPDTGDIQVGGTHVPGMNDADRTRFRRRHIGFIYQFFNLIPVLTVLENVTLVADLDGMKKSRAVERAVCLLEKAGLKDRRNEYPDRLSGGEQQRVAVVRALVNNPRILLADEPTGNLDAATGQQVLKMITDFARAGKKTLVMVTHSVDALAYADRLYTVENNTIILKKEGQLLL